MLYIIYYIVRPVVRLFPADVLGTGRKNGSADHQGRYQYPLKLYFHITWLFFLDKWINRLKSEAGTDKEAVALTFVAQPAVEGVEDPREASTILRTRPIEVVRLQAFVIAFICRQV